MKLRKAMWDCFFRFTLAAVVAAAPLSGALAAVEVIKGPTPIPGGNAQLEGDRTLRNRHLAVSIAVDTAPPYGIPPGSIIDAAPIVDGEIVGAGDTLTQVDFIPNNWSAWPNTYSKTEVVEDSGDRGAVRVKRDWGDVIVTTTWSLTRGSDQVHMVTKMHNAGDKTLTDLLSGYVLWERSGSFFGIPGLVPGPKTQQPIPEEGPADKAFASWNALYGANWAFSVHFPAYEYYDYNGRDLYVKHTLKPGETATFEGWFQVVPSGDLSKILAAESQRKGRAVGTVTGQVETASGDGVAHPAVVVLKDGRPYTWALGESGHYKLPLPEGTYRLYATAQAHSRSPTKRVTVTADETMRQDFAGLREPGEVHLAITDQDGPVDARITIAEGATPLIGFLGRSTFFTQATGDIGTATFAIAPGDYRFGVRSGAGFVSKPVITDTITVPSGQRKSREVQVETTARPNQQGWYAADLHHHSLGAEGVTPPEYVFRSQMAARLDLAFISDHDTMDYLPEMAEIAETRGVPFIASIEISPSWGHFNPYPVKLGQEFTVNPTSATIGEIFQAARDLGAEVIQANHPTNPYGYFTSLVNDSVPGGFNPAFDLIGMNTCCYEDTWKKAQTYWNRYLAGELERFYPISAGSDAHDVWTEISGRIRLYAHVDGDLTVDAFVSSAKVGHSYVTFGPLVYPRSVAGEPERVLFGKTFTVPAGEPFEFALDFKAVRGLRSVTLVREGEKIKSRDLSEHGTTAEDIRFSVTPEQDTWYALVVEDGGKKMAYTNPIWVEIR